ncbi:hypothetical protein ACFX2H_033400 [Malus domestica]
MRAQAIETLTSELGELQKNWGAYVDEIHEKAKLLVQLSAQEESFWQQRNWGDILECVPTSVSDSMNESLLSSMQRCRWVVSKLRDPMDFKECSIILFGRLSGRMFMLWFGCWKVERLISG